MNKMKLGLWVVAAILIALLAGWLWGASGRSDLRTRLAETQLRLSLAETRADLLQARVHLFEVNFGNASRSLQTAKTTLALVSDVLQQRNANDAAQARKVEALIEQAQQMTAKLDQTANARIAEALRLLAALPEAPVQ